MKKIISIILITVLFSTAALAGPGSKRKKVEILPKWSSYHKLKAKYSNAVLDIEDKEYQIQDLKDQNNILEVYVNNRHQEVIIKEKIKTVKEIKEVEVPVLPWFWWVVTVAALLI